MSYNHKNWQVDAEKYFKKLIGGGILIFQFFGFLRAGLNFFYSSKYGGKAFSRVGPKMWNLLPRTVRDVVDALEFKKALKSFLMTRGDEYCHWLTRE